MSSTTGSGWMLAQRDADDLNEVVRAVSALLNAIVRAAERRARELGPLAAMLNVLAPSPGCRSR